MRSNHAPDNLVGAGKSKLSPTAKIALNVAGTICVGLGILGAILPLLPATPFLLLASACYVRGSERLHRWLLGNRHLGPYIVNIKERRGLPRRAKLYTLALLWASLLFSAYRLGGWGWGALLVGVGVGVSALILSLKTLEGEGRGL